MSDAAHEHLVLYIFLVQHSQHFRTKNISIFNTRYKTIYITYKWIYRRGGLVVERSFRMRKVGVRSPVETDLKTGSYSSIAKHSATDVSVMDKHY